MRGIEAALNWFGSLGGLFRGWWDAAANAVHAEIDKLLGFVESIPGRINSALGGLPGMMFRAGVHVISSLLDGIKSMIGEVGSVISSIASKVAGFFGLSPAVEGPLSAGGAPEIRGQHFAADIARGILSGRGAVAAAAGQVARGAAIGPSGGGGYGAAAAAGGGTVTLQIGGGGGSGLDALFMTWLKGSVRTEGGDPAVFSRKVKFL